MQIDQQIINLLASLDTGASLDDIIVFLNGDITPRTLQRRLKDLKESGRVIISGNTRSTRYHLAPAMQSWILRDSFPLSAESEKIRVLLSQPLSKRKPVGYNRDLLDNYVPNETSYLTPAERKKLAALGQTARLHEPAGTYAKEILQRLLIDLSWNSSRLEGNTYSLLDTQRLLAEGKVADDKTAAEAQMLLNHKDAIEFLVQATTDIGFNRYTITNLHAMLSNNLLPNHAASGRLRTFGVGISNSVFMPLGVPQQIEEMFEQMLEKAAAITEPFEQAFFIMVHLPYLQPFDDVNKRVSRLAANIPLNQHNLAPLAFVEVPRELYIQGLLGVYELNRITLLKDVFIWAYEKSAQRYAALRQSLGEPDMFRMHYRDLIRSSIQKIINDTLGPEQARHFIRQTAVQLPAADRTPFIDAVEAELLSLHEGNFARYWVTPSTFARWAALWRPHS